MKEAHDLNASIEELIEQIDLAIAYANAGVAPYTEVQIVTIAYTLIFNTGMYNDACKEWRKRSASNKTWSNYKTHFMDAHDNLRQTQQTAKVAGYHSANFAMSEIEAAEQEAANAHYIENTEVARDEYMADTADALENLATATASDHGAVAQLTDTNEKLVDTNSKLMTQIVTLKKEVELLRKNAKTVNAKQNSRAPQQFKGTRA